MSAIRTFNVEAGLPTLGEARRLVIEEIKRAKREGVKVLKSISAYLGQQAYRKISTSMTMRTMTPREIYIICFRY